MAFVQIILLTVVAIASISSAPVKYDQRQDGEVNVQADLENIVVLIFPSSSASGLNLMDLLRRTVPSSKSSKKHYKSHHRRPLPIVEDDVDDNDSEIEQEMKHFIESKSAAPYHVDISRSKAKYEKLRPEIKSSKEEVLISPSVTLMKEIDLKQELQTFDEEKKTPVEEIVAIPIKISDQKARETGMSENLTLLGSQEQCGPGRKRDEQGICQFY